MLSHRVPFTDGAEKKSDTPKSEKNLFVCESVMDRRLWDVWSPREAATLTSPPDWM